MVRGGPSRAESPSPMNLPPSILAAHEQLSPLSRRFVEFVLEHPETAQKLEFRQLAADAGMPEWIQTYKYAIQSWPALVGAEKLRQIERATVGVTRLLRLIPERVFGHDARRIAEFYGWNEMMVKLLMLEPPTGLESCVTRGDFIDGGTGLKCLEVNASAYLGGWQMRFWEALCRRGPAISAFLAREGVEPVYRDPWRELFTHLVRRACGRGLDRRGELNVALVIDPEAELPPIAGQIVNEVYAEALAAIDEGLAGTVTICEYREGFKASGCALSYRQLPIDAVIEYTCDLTPREVYRCFKAGTIELFNGPLSGVLGDKRNLALLSQLEDSDVFTAEERAVVREHIPWSRDLADGIATHHGERVDLLQFALANRESLIIKSTGGSRGENIYIGRSLSVAEWEARLRAAISTKGFLLQELVQSLPYLYQYGDCGHAPHQAVWGMFCMGESYGGGFLRLMPVERGPSVINSARGAREGIIFEV